MLEGISLDRLRTFMAVVDEGSFSAAGRKLGRAQSVVSHALAALEDQLGFRLFVRSSRKPVLTDEGTALASEARKVLSAMDGFKARARGLMGGLEPSLSIAVDVLYPSAHLSSALQDFRDQFPDTPLSVFVEALGAVLEPAIERRCAFAILGSLPKAPPDFTVEGMGSVDMCVVCRPDHPLAELSRALRPEDLAGHVQLILTDRSALSKGQAFGVLAQNVWRLTDMASKHDMLRKGLGWGFMPRHMVLEDFTRGDLVEILVEGHEAGWEPVPISIAYPTDTPPGPAGRWLIERLRSGAVPNQATQAA